MRDWLAERSIWLGLVTATLTPVAGALVGISTGAWRVPFLVLAAVLAGLAFGIPGAKALQAQARADEAEADAVAARAQMRLAISDALLPVLSYVVSAVDPSGDEAEDPAGPEAVAMVLGAAAQLCGQDGQSRTRACWYRLEPDAEGGAALVPAKHFGRGARPLTVFDVEKPRGRALMELMRDDRTELWPDLEREKPESWQPTTTEESDAYRSVMIVPVRTEAMNLGVITVDADEPGAFTEADENLVHTLANVLALALSQDLAPAAPEVDP